MSFYFWDWVLQKQNERAKILKKTELSKNFFPNIIHKNTIIENNVKIGFGNIIYPFSVVCSGSNIENFCVITHSGIIAHNVQLGSYSLF